MISGPKSGYAYAVEPVRSRLNLNGKQERELDKGLRISCETSHEMEVFPKLPRTCSGVNISDNPVSGRHAIIQDKHLKIPRPPP